MQTAALGAPAGSVGAAIDPWLDEEEVSFLTGIPVSTLQKKRLDGSGPPFVKSGLRQVRYPGSELIAWMASRPTARVSKAVSSTSELAMLNQSK
jgi:predicted DNA-binding transcriptional regulator AlpA